MGAFETPGACAKWKREFDLPFAVVPDTDGKLFEQLTNGWVPCSVLVGPDGKVLFVENEFDETGYTAAIAGLYRAKAEPVARTVERSGPATIVILGAGTGGLVAAHGLRRALGREHRVIVINRSPEHLFEPSLLWLMVGDRRERQIVRPLNGLDRKGIEFHHDEVVEIDVDRRHVRTGSSGYDYDYLIVALGAETAPDTVEGFGEMACDLYSVEGCNQIRSTLESFTGGTIAVLVTSMPFKCPAAPYEAAFLVESYCRKKGMRKDTEIHLFTPEHAPMPVAPPALGQSIAGMLEARNIHYHPLFTFETLRPQAREIVAGDGRAERIDLLIAVPPHQAPEVVRSSGLIGTSGWIHVDPHTLRTEHDGVFAIGDVAGIRLPNGKTLPKAGVFAHNEAEVVVEHIVAEIRGTKSDASFDGKGFCWVELGDGKAGFASGQFYSEPDPVVTMRRPGRMWHWGKVAFEKYWLHRWF